MNRLLIASIAAGLAWAGLAHAQLAAQPATAPAPAGPVEPGLVAEYFRDVREWKDVPAAIQARPFLVRVEPRLDLENPVGEFHGTKLATHFAARYSGILRVETAGKYKLALRSDDGSTLRIADRLVLDNATENRAMREKSAEVELAAGDHPITVEYQQGPGGAGIILAWVPPGAKERKTVPVPAENLFHAPDADDRIAWDKAAWDAYKWDKQAWIREYGPRYLKMNYGPFLSHTIVAGEGNTTLKGIAIKLDPQGKHAVLFDTELLRVSAAWTGDFLHLNGVAFNGAHGPSPRIDGKPLFVTRPGPGWANAAGDFTDPRPEPYGPLPRAWAKYKGLYLSGDRTVLAYTVGDCDVLEVPSVEHRDGKPVFVRTFEVGPSKQTLRLRAADKAQTPEGPLGLELVNAPDGATIDEAGDSLGVSIPPRSTPAVFVVRVRPGPVEATREANGPGFVKPSDLTRGGPPRWTEPVVTKGELGSGDGPYVVDTLTVPESNPWDAWMRLGGVDFFPDGRAAVCTWSGDVWVVSGIDDKLERLTWKRYATGLFQPLGLRIVDGVVHTLGRDQITRLHDLNDDGEADFYENFNNDCHVSDSFHEFALDLQTDTEGNFYYAKGGPVRPGGRGWQTITAHNGTILRVSKDGERFEVFATGVRAPNGMGAGPNGEISVADNEGTWTPTCRLSLVRRGDFLGVVDLAKRDEPPTDYEKPVCWFPHAEVDNSSGGQVWVTSDRWGPFQGDMLHLSYGKAALYKVMYEPTGDGLWQGGVVRFPLTFDTGICRARFHPIDGQLYVAGLKGWQTDGAKDGALQRVRYTGRRVDMPRDLSVTEQGVRITFTSPLDREAAADVENYALEQWNYVWSKEYGSPQVSVADPNVRGRDPVEVDEAVVSEDGRTVLLKITDLEPSMQMKIQYKLKTDDGRPLDQTIYNTINVVKKATSTAGAAN